MSRKAKFTRYSPKKWPPQFDAIVLASIGGKSNKELAALFGYTEQHISNILCSEKANEIKESVRKKLLEENPVTDKLKAISEKAIERMEKFINNDQLATASPFHFVDRAIRMQSVLNPAKEEPKEKNVINNNVLIASPSMVSGLFEAIEKSNEAKLLNSGEIKVE